eukprot:421439-Pleurochrysis_carterae.AAC.1
MRYSQGQSGSGHGCGSWTHLWVSPGPWRSQAVSAMRATRSQNLRSGARVLRRYACDTSAKWETVHAGQKERRAASVSSRLLATRAKWRIIGREAKNEKIGLDSNIDEKSL